jgi:hypothetical protein
VTERRQGRFWWYRPGLSPCRFRVGYIGCVRGCQHPHLLLFRNVGHNRQVVSGRSRIDCRPLELLPTQAGSTTAYHLNRMCTGTLRQETLLENRTLGMGYDPGQGKSAGVAKQPRELIAHPKSLHVTIRDCSVAVEVAPVARDELRRGERRLLRRGCHLLRQREHREANRVGEKPVVGSSAAALGGRELRDEERAGLHAHAARYLRGSVSIQSQPKQRDTRNTSQLQNSSTN